MENIGKLSNLWSFLSNPVKLQFVICVNLFFVLLAVF